MLEDIVANLANHAETGQIPKPYRRGSWRPIGHMRPSSPLLDSVRDQFEGNKNHFPTFYGIFISFPPSPPTTDYDQLAKDFTRVFLNLEPSCLQNAHLFDVVFLVGQSKQKARFIGVRAILGVRSRVFQVRLSHVTTFNMPKFSIDTRRKCYMESKPDLDHRKYLLLNCYPDPHRHFYRHKIIVQKAQTSCKFPTLNHARKVFLHRRWLKELFHVLEQ